MLHVTKTYNLLFRAMMDGEQEEMTCCNPAINGFLVALDDARVGSALLSCDCRGNTLIDIAGGGWAVTNANICCVLL